MNLEVPDKDFQAFVNDAQAARLTDEELADTMLDEITGALVREVNQRSAEKKRSKNKADQ